MVSKEIEALQKSHQSIEDQILHQTQVKTKYSELSTQILKEIQKELERYRIKSESELVRFLISKLNRTNPTKNAEILEANLDQCLEEFDLFIQAHRNDQRLIAIAEIHTAPDRRLFRVFLLRPAQIKRRR